MRPGVRRLVPEPIAELLRPVVHPSDSERAYAEHRLSVAPPTITGRLRSRLATVRRRLGHVVQVRPAINPRLRRAEGEIDKLRRIARHGSLTMGRHDWETRWRDHDGPRVLMFAFKDYAGSFYDWAEALNSETTVAARHAVVETSKFGFPADLVYSDDQSSDRLDGLIRLAEEADVIHVKDEFAFDLPDRHHLVERLRSTGRPIVFTQYGGYARSQQDNLAYRSYAASFDGRVALTADLAFDWFDGVWIPHAHRVDPHRSTTWRDGFVVAHSPSTPERKGTDLALAAIHRIDEHLPIDFDMITGVSVDESLRRKQSATLFFDQAGRESQQRLGTDRHVGWYGKSAVEAMEFGIPVMAHLSPTALRQAGDDFSDRCPIINVEPTVESIAQEIVTFFERSEADRRAVADATAAWVAEFHGPQRVGALLEAVYRGVMS